MNRWLWSLSLCSLLPLAWSGCAGPPMYQIMTRANGNITACGEPQVRGPVYRFRSSQGHDVIVNRADVVSIQRQPVECR